MRLRSLRLFTLALVSLLAGLTSQAEASFVLFAPAAESENSGTASLRTAEGQQAPWSSQEWVDLLQTRVVPNYAFDVQNVSRGLGAGPPPAPTGASGALCALPGGATTLCNAAVAWFIVREERRRAVRSSVHIFRPPETAIFPLRCDSNTRTVNTRRQFQC